MRKDGKASSPEDRMQWSGDDLVRQLKMGIRTDYGGVDNKGNIMMKRVEAMLELLENDPGSITEVRSALAGLSTKGKGVLGDLFLAVAKHTRDGIAKRLSGSIDEVERRLIGD